MKRGKKIALIALLAVVAIAGTIGGVALANDGDEETAPATETPHFAMLERVCEIYQEKTGVAIDPDILQESLCQAAEERREQAREQFRQHLIDEGILTEEELAEWDAWLADIPDMPEGLGLGLGQGRAHRFMQGLANGLGGWCNQGNGNSTSD